MFAFPDTLKAIFFDFGSTLIYTRDPWPPIYERADRAMLLVLHQAGLSLEPASFAAEFGTFLDRYYADRGSSIVEKTTLCALSEFLAARGYDNLPTPLLRSALDALYAVTQQNWYLEEDAVSTLAALRERSFRLGMISNTSDDDNVQQLLDRYGLRPYFETVVTSAGCGIRKPDSRIFNLALQALGIAPQQAAMVGDSLEADIFGANRLGLYSIWISRRSADHDPSPAHPYAIVDSLSQILSILPVSI